MWSRSDIKAKGKENFKRNYWKSVFAALIYSLFFVSTGSAVKSNDQQITDAINSAGLDPDTLFIVAIAVLGILAFILFILTILDIFVFNPLEVGCTRFFLVNSEENADIGELGHAYKHGYINTVFGIFLRNFLISLGFILLIIPGCILTYSYRMVPYILAEDPTISGVAALKKSRAMMYGHKWNTLVYDLSYILWFILVGLTLGLVGLFYVNPWKHNADAVLYKTIKG